MNVPIPVDVRCTTELTRAIVQGGFIVVVRGTWIGAAHSFVPIAQAIFIVVDAIVAARAISPTNATIVEVQTRSVLKQSLGIVVACLIVSATLASQIIAIAVSTRIYNTDTFVLIVTDAVQVLIKETGSITIAELGGNISFTICLLYTSDAADDP